jgi:hypothetical protein
MCNCGAFPGATKTDKKGTVHFCPAKGKKATIPFYRREKSPKMIEAAAVLWYTI